MEIINKYCSECLRFNGICWLKWDMLAGMGYAIWNGICRLEWIMAGGPLIKEKRFTQWT
nr:hypothetical protein [uncultured Agathobacter sp.]